MRISDWSSDVCSSHLLHRPRPPDRADDAGHLGQAAGAARHLRRIVDVDAVERVGEAVEIALPPHLAGADDVDADALMRSVERTLGQACVRTCMSRWSPYH